MSSLARLNILEKFDDQIEDSDKYIVIHSALHRLPVEPENLKWKILRYFVELSNSGHTLLVPSFTFSFTSNGKYDLENSPSEVGILGDWVGELCSAKRTNHPIYSFVCLGPHTKQLLDCDVSTCFGRKSIFSYLAGENTKIVLLGADWTSCTQFHYLEEMHQVPYRHHKKFTGTFYEGDKSRVIGTDMYVRNLDLGVENDFSKQISEIENKERYELNVDDQLVQSVQIREFMRTGNRLLSEDKFNFVKNKKQLMHSVEGLDSKREKPPVKVLLYGSRNLELLARVLSKKFFEFEKEVSVEIDTCEYGRHKELLYRGSSKFRYDIVIAVEKLQDLASASAEVTSEDVILDAVELYIDDIKQIEHSLGKLVFVNEFTKSSLSHGTISGSIEQSKTVRAIDKANMLLHKDLEGLEDVVLTDIDHLAVSNGIKVIDDRLYFHGKIPFSLEMSEEMAKKWVSYYLARAGKTIRLLIVDLDNTIWGGIVGEDGISGLSIGGDYPGNIYKNFQRVLKKLSEHGIALAIVSKNNEDEAIEVLQKHPEMELRLDDFVAYRINWNDKASNILEIAQEVGLGLKNIGYVDDNPVERDLVRNLLPDVKVFPLGNDPVDYLNVLLSSPYLQMLRITEEDTKRTRRYLQRAKVAKVKQKFTNLEEFYRHLSVRVFIQNLDKYNTSRACQLVEKTTQFNATGMRYSKSELEGLGQNVIVIAAEDKLSERENLGLITIFKHVSDGCTEIHITSFLLSCRALGKGIEQAVISWLAHEVTGNHFHKIVAHYNKTGRNMPVEQLYRSLDMREIPEGFEFNEDEIRHFKTRETAVEIVDERGLTQC